MSSERDDRSIDNSTFDGLDDEDDDEVEVEVGEDVSGNKRDTQERRKKRARRRLFESRVRMSEMTLTSLEMQSRPKLGREGVLLRKMLEDDGQREHGERLLRNACAETAAPKMVVLVGIPGSGKSTFGKQLQERGWLRISQDDLGNRFRCEVELIKGLLRGQNVVVDRCNFDEEQRYPYIRCGLLRGCRIGAVVFAIPVEDCIDRVMNRTQHETLPASKHAANVVRRFASMYRPPNQQEGFSFCRHIRNSHDSNRILDELCQ